MDNDAFYKITQGVYVLGAQDGERLVGCMVDAVMQVANTPLMIAVSSHKGSYTRTCIEASRRFSLSVLPRNIAPQIIENFGFYSSETRNKWDNVGLEIRHNLPFLLNNIATFACEVEQVLDLPNNTLFVGKVFDVQNSKNEEPMTYQYYRAYLKNSINEDYDKNKEKNVVENSDKQWVCQVCGYVYHEDTPFDTLPDDWVCPLCGVDKTYFIYQ